MSTRTDTMSENAKIETGSNADPKAQGDPSGESVLGATPCSVHPSLSLERDNFNLANMLTKAERERDSLKQAVRDMVKAKGRYNTQKATENLISLVPDIVLPNSQRCHGKANKQSTTT